MEDLKSKKFVVQAGLGRGKNEFIILRFKDHAFSKRYSGDEARNLYALLFGMVTVLPKTFNQICNDRVERAQPPEDRALRLIRQIARLTYDGEMIDGKEFTMENDDAVETLSGLISSARDIAGVTPKDSEED